MTDPTDPQHMREFQSPALDHGSRYQFRAGGDEPTESVAGNTYLFEFPFPIFVDRSLQDGIVFARDGNNVRISSPFSRSGSEWLEAPAIPHTAVPAEAGPPTGWTITGYSTAIDRLGIPCYCLRVDLAPDPGDDTATHLALEFLQHLRSVTNQWWVGHDATPFYDHIRHSFAIDSDWNRVGNARIHSGCYGLWGFERPLRDDDMRILVGRMSRRLPISLAHQLFFDGIFAHSANRIGETVVTLAMASEARLGETVARFGKATGWPAKKIRKFTNQKFVHKLEAVHTLLGWPPMSKAAPAEFQWLRTLWVARGNFAHGRQVPVRFPNGSRRHLASQDLREIILAIAKLFQYTEDGSEHDAT